MKSIMEDFGSLLKAVAEEELDELMETGEDIDVAFFQTGCVPTIAYARDAEVIKAASEFITDTIGDKTGSHNFEALTKAAEAVAKAGAPEYNTWDGRPGGELVMQEWKQKAQEIHDFAAAAGATCKGDTAHKDDGMEDADDEEDKKSKKKADDAAAKAKAKKAKDKKPPASEDDNEDGEDDGEGDDDGEKDPPKKKSKKAETIDPNMAALTKSMAEMVELLKASREPGRNPPLPARNTVAVDKKDDTGLNKGDDGDLNKAGKQTKEDVLKSVLAAPRFGNAFPG